jgi:hypothetical protein
MCRKPGIRPGKGNHAEWRAPVSSGRWNSAVLPSRCVPSPRAPPVATHTRTHPPIAPHLSLALASGYSARARPAVTYRRGRAHTHARGHISMGASACARVRKAAGPHAYHVRCFCCCCSCCCCYCECMRASQL